VASGGNWLEYIQIKIITFLGADATICVWDLNGHLNTIGTKGTVMDQFSTLIDGHVAEIQDVKFKPGDDNVRAQI